MSVIFITGLSGCGKSTTIEALKSLGYHAYDLDYGYTKTFHDETLIDEVKLLDLLEAHNNTPLFISACYANQGIFYKYFDKIILLHASLPVMKSRIASRLNNSYGKDDITWLEIEKSYDEILPQLKRGANIIIDSDFYKLDDVIGICLECIK
jgi:RNase adaptor protein for sRNA GlmZ degradation